MFTHVRPDGDTLGSALGFKFGMEKLGKTVDIYSSDIVPKKFYFIEETQEILNELKGVKYDAYISLDCSEIYRLGNFGDFFTKEKNTFSIDHHISNTHFAKINFVRDTASNSENVYELLKYLGVTFDKKIATPLLMGMSTDTGNFAHKNTTGNVLACAGELVEYGADINDINYKMFRNQSKQRAKLYGLVMSKIRFFIDDKLAIISVLKDDLVKSGAPQDSTEGFIDFIMDIETTQVAICILEVKDKQFKISFRSKGADVNEIAGIFGGGGHILASGCMINGYYEDVMDKLVFACKQRIE